MAIASRSPAKPGVATRPALKSAPPAASGKATLGEAHEAIIKVSTTILEGGTIKGEPVEQEEREVKVFATAPAHASVTLGYNKNLGNIEMAKVTVFVSMPCYVEEFDSAFAQVLDKAKSCLETAIGEVNIEGAAVASAEGVPGEPGVAPADETALTAEDINGYDHDQLVELATGNPDLGVNPDDYTSDDDLKEVLISVIFPDEVGAPAEETVEAYTQEALDGATTDELKAVFEAWGMGKYPPGPEKIAKKTAIKKILEKQEEAIASQATE